MTPTALASESRRWVRSGWRAVEAQHRVATMGLAQGSRDSQAVLEDILEETKPRLPSAAAGLHFLLATPFRYPPLPSGSRFRGKDDPGVFYGAEDQATACAESGYWRLVFWRDSEFLAQRPKAVPLTLFEFHGASERSLDLSQPPLSADRKQWTDPSDYSPTQALAQSARQGDIELIRYESVRNPGGFCVAILSPAVFRAVKEAFRHQQQTWTLHLHPPRRIVWQRELSKETLAFDFPEWR